jgi:hypothetical protein
MPMTRMKTKEIFIYLFIYLFLGPWYRTQLFPYTSTLSFTCVSDPCGKGWG